MNSFITDYPHRAILLGMHLLFGLICFLYWTCKDNYKNFKKTILKAPDTIIALFELLIILIFATAFGILTLLFIKIEDYREANLPPEPEKDPSNEDPAERLRDPLAS